MRGPATRSWERHRVCRPVDVPASTCKINDSVASGDWVVSTDDTVASGDCVIPMSQLLAATELSACLAVLTGCEDLRPDRGRDVNIDDSVASGDCVV